MTLREHLEAISWLHRDCGNCGHGVICPEVEHAQSALELLNNCGLQPGVPRSRDMRLVPDARYTESEMQAMEAMTTTPPPERDA